MLSSDYRVRLQEICDRIANQEVCKRICKEVLIS